MRIKPHKSVEQIARKHRMDVSDIQNQLDMGVPIEHEHTRNKTLATDIALQHLDEIPDYYTRLKKMEASAKKEHKKFRDVKEDAVTDLQRGITELPDASYGSIDNLMRRIMKKRNISAEKLHNDFVNKHHQTPDTWAKRNMKEEKGLWDNIHARREKGLPRKKPGQKGYPKTLDIEEDLKQARKNVGASKCWSGKVAKGTKIKNGVEVPDCRPIKEESDTRYCPKCAKEETRNECKYGPKYWDMFSTPISLASNSYDPNKPHPANEEKDHEYSMARSEISTIIGAAKRLKKKMGKGEGNIEAWVQSKITKAADYIDTAADYVDSREMAKESRNPLKDPGTQIKKSSGAGALTPEAAKQLGPKAEELRKKKVAKVDLPKVNKESVTIEDSKGNTFLEIIDIIHPEKMKGMSEDHEKEDYKKFDNAVNTAMALKDKKTRVKVLTHAAKNHPSKKKTFESFVIEASAAWQRKEGKNPEGGLNKKGIASYRKQHPGSHLSLAVTTKPSKLKKGSKSANRRKSFCSRMKGMKAKLASAKTAHDPDSRINKSLRKWNC